MEEPKSPEEREMDDLSQSELYSTIVFLFRSNENDWGGLSELHPAF
jgi:hypothetical protein